MDSDPKSETRSYRRDDGVLMIEVRPGQFINESAFGLLKQTVDSKSRPASSLREPKRGNYRRKRTAMDG